MAEDERITKRKVTMRSSVALPPTEDHPDGGVATHEAVDYVRPDFLDAYVADARTRWQVVTVSDEPDAGPGGYEGDTDDQVHLRELPTTDNPGGFGA